MALGRGHREAGASGSGAGGQQRRSAPPSIGELLNRLAVDLVGQLSGRVHLLALELKRARQALLHIAVMAVLVAILGASAWIALWVVGVTLAIKGGLSWLGASILVLTLNLLGAWLAFRRARALVVHLALPATVRQLTAAKADHGIHA
jgi:uncharacterized membrane protein YqjE